MLPFPDPSMFNSRRCNNPKDWNRMPFRIGNAGNTELFAKDASLPVFVNSFSLKAKLIQNYCLNTNAIFVLPNLVPESSKTFAKSIEPQRLHKVAVVSNHVPDEERAMARKLNRENITTDFFGIQDQFVPITPELLSGYDCIVSIGKTVQYALALGIPVFNYDHFGGEGYILKSNIDQEEYYNFSGRRTLRKISADELVNELICGFSGASKDALALRAIAYERYFVSDNIDRILTILNGWAFHKIEESQSNRMFFHYCSFIIKQVEELQQVNNRISNAFFWKISKPLRMMLDFVKKKIIFHHRQP